VPVFTGLPAGVTADSKMLATARGGGEFTAFARGGDQRAGRVWGLGGGARPADERSATDGADYFRN